MKNSIKLIKKIKEAWPDSKILVITKDESIIAEFKKAGLKGDHRPHDPVKPEADLDNEPRYLKAIKNLGDKADEIVKIQIKRD